MYIYISLSGYIFLYEFFVSVHTFVFLVCMCIVCLYILIYKSYHLLLYIPNVFPFNSYYLGMICWHILIWICPLYMNMFHTFNRDPYGLRLTCHYLACKPPVFKRRLCAVSYYTCISFVYVPLPRINVRMTFFLLMFGHSSGGDHSVMLIMAFMTACCLMPLCILISVLCILIVLSLVIHALVWTHLYIFARWVWFYIIHPMLFSHRNRRRSHNSTCWLSLGVIVHIIITSFTDCFLSYSSSLITFRGLRAIHIFSA